MKNTELSTCCTCGYQWKTGTHGGHSCSAILQQKTARLREELNRVTIERELYAADAKRCWEHMPEFADNPADYELHEAVHELKQRAEAAEAQIREAEEQEPVGYGDRLGSHWQSVYCIPDGGVPLWMRDLTPLYTHPIPSPTEVELQSQLAAANSRIAVLDAANVQQAEEIERLKSALSDLSESEKSGKQIAMALALSNKVDELTKLLAEERKKAVPEGWKLVPIEPTDTMLCELANQWDSVGKTTMLDNYRSMLTAAQKPEDK